MAPVNVALLTQKVKLFFEKNHILTLPEWISECLDYLSDELGNDCPSDDEVVDLVYKQWLFSDLREFSLQIFPHNSANTVLNGNYCVQINSLLDVSRSFYSQYQSFTGKLELDDSDNDDDNANELKNSNEKTENDNKNCRMIVLELTDGITTLRAMEYHPIPQLELTLMPGCKVRLTGPIRCINEMLLLKSENITILGGSCDSLEKSWRQRCVKTIRSLKTPFSKEPPVLDFLNAYHVFVVLQDQLFSAEKGADESWQGQGRTSQGVTGSALLLNQNGNWPDWNRATNDNLTTDDRMLEPVCSEQASLWSTNSRAGAAMEWNDCRFVGNVTEVDLFDADELFYDLPTTNLDHGAEHSTSGDEAESRNTPPELSADFLYGDIADFFPENEPEFMEIEPENLTYLSTNVATVQLENNATLCIEHDISNGIQMKSSLKFEKRNFVYIAEIVSEQFTASQGEYTLRAIILNILGKLDTNKGSHWSLMVKLNDSTGSIDCSLSDSLLCELIGMSASEAWDIKTRLSGDLISKNRALQGLKRCGQILREFDGTVEIRFVGAGKLPLLIQLNPKQVTDLFH
ncbi:RecQ-mediated genome instability protein 1 [Trichinella pseudospiralis]|uniref:RecQ-mediated genome instability protein 1 n=1 Tax=Trichinella pseudospiralis TaxID=6337 RepID=A0A0V1J3P9_TRIPS|nr:RecQ-mediated genome instability protein 1 [Trichinella pseudospiralis]KRZ36086.1 RecQ-mediated genome instability protein 1 [Trichinella pseudospiralis]